MTSITEFILKRKMSVRPRSCGAYVDIHAYLRWKIYHAQLWRTRTYSTEETKPLVSPSKVKTTRSPPRKGDFVSLGNKNGEIIYISRDSGQIEDVTVEWKDGTESDFDPGYFTSYSPFMGRKLWLLPDEATA